MEPVEFLAVLLPLLACSSISLLLCFNLYIKIRKKFSIKVNCWFCNNWMKVPYDKKNNFYCYHCNQYNGFSEDGGYNKIIDEQHDELLNQKLFQQNNFSTYPINNGLCKFCNNNQMLKVYQLASFTPLVEENYDKEIEHYEKQLERAYRLCSKCEITVKNKIYNETKWLLGLKFLNILNKNNAKHDKNLKTTKIKHVTNKSSFSIRILKVFNFTFALLIVLNVLPKLGFSFEDLNEYLPRSILLICNSAQQYLYTVFENIENNQGYQIVVSNTKRLFSNTLIFGNFLLSTLENSFSTQDSLKNIIEVVTVTEIKSNLFFKTDNFIFMSCTGLFLQLLLIYLQSNGIFFSVINLLPWCVLSTLPYLKTLEAITSHQLKIAQVIAALIIICSSFVKLEEKFQRKPFTLKKLKLTEEASKQTNSDKVYNSTPNSSRIQNTSTNTASFSTSPFSSKSTVFNDWSNYSQENTYTKAQNIYNIHNNSFVKDRNTYLPHQEQEFKVFTPRSRLYDSFTDNMYTAKSSYSPGRSTSNLTSFETSSAKKIQQELSTSFNDLCVSKENYFKLNSSKYETASVYSLNCVPRPKPVLSPARLSILNKNSWGNGSILEGVGKLDTNLSRSSSQTSGYTSLPGGTNVLGGFESGSNKNFKGNFGSNPNFSSINGKFDTLSNLSEPYYSYVKNSSFSNPYNTNWRPLSPYF